MDSKELIALIRAVDNASSDLAVAVNCSNKGHQKQTKALDKAKAELFKAVMGRKPDDAERRDMEG